MPKKRRTGRAPLMTKPLITRAQALAFKKRWAAVNAYEIEELRRTPPAVRLRQLATLMSWAKAFGWTDALAAEEEAVRDRWNRLRRAYRV